MRLMNREANSLVRSTSPSTSPTSATGDTFSSKH